jgi:hypothetical protein
MGYARHSRKDLQAGDAPVEPRRQASAPIRIDTQFAPDYFDTRSETAARAAREPTVLRQARQMRDAWRRGRYGRLRGA